MTTRKTTCFWEQHKNQYTNCLCYSDEIGLYTNNIPEGYNPEELLCRPQGYIGKTVNKIKLPGRNIEITIFSNFGFGRASYLRATLDLGNTRFLDFDISKLYILNNCSITTLDVPVYRWDILFEKIINAYNVVSFENITTSAIAYIEGLSEILDRNVITVKDYTDNDKATQWKGEYLISLYVGRKIQDLVDGIETAKVSDTTLLKYTMNLCRKFVKKLKVMTCDHEMSPKSHLPEYLLSVHKFMCANKKGKEYLNIILDKEL